MKNKMGVMQGRLLPKYKGRYQAHPLGYWQEEFQVAQRIGLDCIEFILDFNDADSNPLLKEGGIDEIKSMIIKTGINVNTICADYLMEAPLHSEEPSVCQKSQDIMAQLLSNAAKLGVSDVVIPCVDKSSLSTKQSANRFVKQLLPLITLAEKFEINLSLETDLGPKPFLELLNRFRSDRVTVNYDIGNSAALGYDPIEELDAYGGKISDIHIKDRLRSSGPVVLGGGNADFDIFFKKLAEFDYQGPFIMQAYRDDEGVEMFEKQWTWIQPYLKNFTSLQNN
jgi:sugar phosphate isomerase/epimerase